MPDVNSALPPPPQFQFPADNRFSQYIGRVSPCGELYGSSNYWHQLRQLYLRERARIRAMVPDGQWIAFSFEWLDQNPHRWFASKAEARQDSLFAIVVRPGYEHVDLAPAYPIVAA